MAAQPKESKVLRIGIIQDGKIVQERLVKAGESVTVGESAKNTFVFPKTPLPAEFTLFQATNKGYVLQFTEDMKGKISSGGAVVALQKLSKDPSVQKSGSVFQLALSPQDRGKLSVDSITVLFQFVSPPPVKAVKPIQAMDFRPRMFEEDDPVFLGFLAIWSALAVVMMIYVWNTEPRELTLEELPDRLTRVIIPPKDDTPPPDDNPVADEGEKPKEEPKEDAPAEETIAKGPVDKAAEAANKEKKKDDVVKSSKLLMKMIGTTGESKGGVVENLWSAEEQGIGSVDEALKETGGITSDKGEASRSGAGGKGDAATIDNLGGVGGGNTQLSGGPVFKMDVQSGEGSLEEMTGDKGAVSSVVKKNLGQLKYCYESQLKQNPNLQGRVEIGWTVAAGKATGVYVVSNSTGDPELADCIEQKIKRWQFPPDADGDISWPFVFQASKG